jgi:ubiquinone/menaquinone biosynthesis C-methylase UbiE
MTDIKIAFDDGEAYELFMGRWSRAVGTQFLAWLSPPKAARWLDVGCGTGVFTRLIVDSCAPGGIAGVDPSAAQISKRRRRPPTSASPTPPRCLMPTAVSTSSPRRW